MTPVLPLQRELEDARTKLAAAEREHATAVKQAEEASIARQAVTAKTDQLTKQRDDVMVVRIDMCSVRVSLTSSAERSAC